MYRRRLRLWALGAGLDSCDTAHADESDKLPYIPNDIECKWIRPQAFFPNCWNGKDSYLPDNSHVIYPTGNFESGACPAGFVRIPSLFMEGGSSLLRLGTNGWLADPPAYYKVPENMGSEYEWYPGCLVLLAESALTVH